MKKSFWIKCFLLLIMLPFPVEARTTSDLILNGRSLVLIGDVHGDLVALQKILMGLGLINQRGSWIGGNRVLVLMGDLIDRGPDSLAIMQKVMQWEQEAQQQGGHVEALLGNHELLLVQEVIKDVSLAEHLSYWNYEFEGERGLTAVFHGNSPIAQWIRNRRSIIRVIPDEGPRLLLVHAGLDYWALDTHPDQVNAWAQDWIAYRQGVAEMPDESTEWVIGTYGPLWTRRMAQPEHARIEREEALAEQTRYFEREIDHVFGVDADPEVLFEPEPRVPPKLLSREDLEKIKRAWGFDRVVVGHTGTFFDELGKEVDEDRILRQSPTWGRQLIRVDTGISEYYGGRLSALLLEKGRFIPRYFRRPTQVDGLALESRQACLVDLQKVVTLEQDLGRSFKTKR